MRKIFSILLTLLLFFASCDTRNCDNVVCQANANCRSGQCYCEDGYEGNDCASLSYQKYIGNYQVQEICDNGGSNFSTYSAYIQPTGYPQRVIITGLFGMGVTADAIIRTDGNNKGNIIEINQQSLGSLIFSGEGVYDDFTRRLTINFNYTFGGNPYNCQHTFYPQ